MLNTPLLGSLLTRVLSNTAGKGGPHDVSDPRRPISMLNFYLADQAGPSTLVPGAHWKNGEWKRDIGYVLLLLRASSGPFPFPKGSKIHFLFLIIPRGAWTK
jgi:hypothetical protein